jgi:hypothetical protein
MHNIAKKKTILKTTIIKRVEENLWIMEGD